jgi:hypothetical protein
MFNAIDPAFTWTRSPLANPLPVVVPAAAWAALTVTVTIGALVVPPAPVHDSPYVVVLGGVTDTVPLVPFVPLQPWVAVQVVAFVLLQVNRALCPAWRLPALLVKITVGAAGGTCVDVILDVED